MHTQQTTCLTLCPGMYEIIVWISVPISKRPAVTFPNKWCASIVASAWGFPLQAPRFMIHAAESVGPENTSLSQQLPSNEQRIE